MLRKKKHTIFMDQMLFRKEAFKVKVHLKGLEAPSARLRASRQEPEDMDHLLIRIQLQGQEMELILILEVFPTHSKYLNSFLAEHQHPFLKDKEDLPTL